MGGPGSGRRRGGGVRRSTFSVNMNRYRTLRKGTTGRGYIGRKNARSIAYTAKLRTNVKRYLP